MERDSRENQQRQASVGTSGLEGAFAFLTQLHEAGVRTAVICPGGRNAPMVQALELIKWDWEICNFVDERSAAFFALARAKRDNAPVLVSVTSGTAAAELLPAAIEAHATNVPLILATADRPRSHRGSGSPQSMWQVGLFSEYAPTVVDWQEGEAIPEFTKMWNQRSPIHINLCHQEPLWNKTNPTVPEASSKKLTKTSWPKLTAKFPEFKNPLVLVGALSADEHDTVKEFCRWYQAPVLAEASSGIRESGLPNLMLAGDRTVRHWFKRGEFDGIIRLGQVPSWRLWRDLEFWQGPVVAFGRTLWSGLPERTVNSGELIPWLKDWIQQGPRAQLRTELQQEDRLNADKREKLLIELPHSEPALVRQVSVQAAPGAMMYLGNSRPVRDWNEQALLTKKFEIQENRGLNGIDGQLSSFYGHARPDIENWALIGDLTTIYDMQGPWAIRHLSKKTHTRLVVMNNSGGQIFSRMFPSELFLNRHKQNFAPLAEFWRLHYDTQLNVSAPHALIELTPDAQETTAFREQWEKL